MTWAERTNAEERPWANQMNASRRRESADSTFSKIASTWGKVPVTPVQRTPQYNSSAAAGTINSFSDFLTSLTQPSTDFGFQKIGWTDVTAQSVSSTQEAQRALTYNQSHISDFADMAAAMTSADTTTKMAMLDRINPGWSKQRDQAAEVNSSLIAGEVPKDVQERIASTAAFQSVMGGGYGGAGNARAVTAADFGNTSLDLMQAGQQGAMSWTQMLNSMLPVQTTANQVAQQSGLSTTDAINTALGNADRRMTGDIESGRSKQTAGIQNASLTLQSATARSNELSNYTNVLMNGRTNLLQSQLGLIQDMYAADTNASNIQFANADRPYQAAMEFQGLMLGQKMRTGYGI